VSTVKTKRLGKRAVYNHLVTLRGEKKITPLSLKRGRWKRREEGSEREKWGRPRRPSGIERCRTGSSECLEG